MVKFFVTGKRLACAAALITMVMAMASCAKENDETLMAQEQNNTCDTVNMKYSVNVVPILSANCYSCHANGIVNAGVTLDSYANVIQQVPNGFIIGAITHAPGFVPMPYGLPQLSPCDIAIIKAWIDEGAPNN
jgi:hypothetical protein